MPNLAEASLHCRTADFWVVDINLPDGTGPTWVEQQRKAGLSQTVLLLSHGSGPGDLDRLRDCGYAPKPSSLEDLKEMMQGWWSA